MLELCLIGRSRGLARDECGASAVSWIVGIFALFVAAGAVARGMTLQAEAGAENLGVALASGAGTSSEEPASDLPTRAMLERNPLFQHAGYDPSSDDRSEPTASHPWLHPIASDQDVELGDVPGSSARDPSAWLSDESAFEDLFRNEKETGALSFPHDLRPPRRDFDEDLAGADSWSEVINMYVDLSAELQEGAMRRLNQLHRRLEDHEELIRQAFENHAAQFEEVIKPEEWMTEQQRAEARQRWAGNVVWNHEIQWEGELTDGEEALRRSLDAAFRRRLRQMQTPEFLRQGDDEGTEIEI